METVPQAIRVRNGDMPRQGNRKSCSLRCIIKRALLPLPSIDIATLTDRAEAFGNIMIEHSDQE